MSYIHRLPRKLRIIKHLRKKKKQKTYSTRGGGKKNRLYRYVNVRFLTNTLNNFSSVGNYFLPKIIISPLNYKNQQGIQIWNKICIEKENKRLMNSRTQHPLKVKFCTKFLVRKNPSYQTVKVNENVFLGSP